MNHKKYLWCSDIHLNCIRSHVLDYFCNYINKQKAQGLIITGDISEANNVFYDLLELEQKIKIPIYYVFGNHDFYCSSIKRVRRTAASFHLTNSNCIHLGSNDVINLNQNTVLIGDDGWYDGLNGDYNNSDVQLNDFFYIDELSHLSKFERKKVLESLTQDSADRLNETLKAVIKDSKVKKIIIATHVPPFHGAAWYNDCISEPFYAPFFSNRIIGETIMNTTKEFRENDGKIQILCGHTHWSGKMYPGMNAECLTASAEYGNPRIYLTLEI